MSGSSSQPPTSDNGSSIAEAMARQTCFNTALSLGQSPTMIFGGELHKYVQFVTMFKNSFNKTINNSVALYEILMRHEKCLRRRQLNLVSLAPTQLTGMRRPWLS